MKFFSFFERNEAPQDITIQKLLGSGKYQVFKGQTQGKKEECAAKIFPATQIAEEAYQKELAILSKVKHKNVISLIRNTKTVDNQRNHVLVMEYTPYGDFFDLVMSRELKDEILIRTYFHQMIDAIECLHSNGIAHLDLKLDNLLLGKNYLLKVTDFDLSHSINQSIKPFSRGTAGYRAPEVWNGTFNNSLGADVYSMGIILYIFLTGEFPFLERETNKGKELQCYKAFCEQNETFWKEKSSYLEINLQSGVKELLNGMLAKNPSVRFTIKEIKASKWYKGPVAAKSTLGKAMKLVVEQVRKKQ